MVGSVGVKNMILLEEKFVGDDKALESRGQHFEHCKLEIRIQLYGNLPK